MTLQEAKDQAKEFIETHKDYAVPYRTIDEYVTMVAKLYAQSKWNEACIATRLDDGSFIFSGANPSEIDEDFYTRPKPEFKP